MATNKEKTESTGTTDPKEATVTLSVNELQALIATEVTRAVAAIPKATVAAPLTKEDLKGLIDIHGRTYQSTAKLRTAVGGTVVKED